LNKTILNTKIQEFINSNLNFNIGDLLLQGTSFKGIETKTIIEQIEAKKKCKKKLSTWFSTENIYYPNKLNIEQTSSEITAKYKTELINGDSIIDLTGGFGVDCFYFSKRFKNITHCEINQELSKIVKHNYQQLNVTNILPIQKDGIAYLKNSTEIYDWIYIDPSRRHDSKGKVFFLNDCIPNVPEHLNLFFQHSKNMLIKTSPLLDFSVGIHELMHVKTIHVVAVNNEVKELLWILEANFKGQIAIETVNIKKNTSDFFGFISDDENIVKYNYSQPLTYLYEPNSAILKAGAFNSISNKLKVFKLHKHSHLYTADVLIDFPGRKFKIEQQLLYSKKAIKKLGLTKANITTRNFPETVHQIRKKFKINDGGEIYLFFTTNLKNEKIVILAFKMSSLSN